MRFAAAIALGLFVVGALLTWATDWVVAGTDGDTIGAILMIVGGSGLFALIIISASRTRPRGAVDPRANQSTSRMTV